MSKIKIVIEESDLEKVKDKLKDLGDLAYTIEIPPAPPEHDRDK